MLPAVITQQVSCELGLSHDQKLILAIVQYGTAAISSIRMIPFLRKLPRRPVILFSLYISICGAILCATVPNYSTLLLSRIIFGIAFAINIPPITIYISELSPNRYYFVLATVLTGIGWTAGGGWCGILGYLFLESRLEMVCSPGIHSTFYTSYYSLSVFSSRN